MLNAAGLREYAQVIHVAIEFREGSAGGLEIKLGALFAQRRRLNVGARSLARGSKR
jgi:hypothetical protein